jgi:hypothetical protein
MWTWVLGRAQRVRLKARRKKPSQGKSLLSKREQSSGSGESAVVHFVKSDHTSFGEESSDSDNDPAVVRTVETQSVVGRDVPTLSQRKETRSSRGILSL